MKVSFAGLAWLRQIQWQCRCLWHQSCPLPWRSMRSGKRDLQRKQLCQCWELSLQLVLDCYFTSGEKGSKGQWLQPPLQNSGLRRNWRRSNLGYALGLIVRILRASMKPWPLSVATLSTGSWQRTTMACYAIKSPQMLACNTNGLWGLPSSSGITSRCILYTAKPCWGNTPDFWGLCRNLSLDWVNTWMSTVQSAHPIGYVLALRWFSLLFCRQLDMIDLA